LNFFLIERASPNSILGVSYDVLWEIVLIYRIDVRKGWLTLKILLADTSKIVGYKII